jgi:hypothetical protein
MNIFPIYLSDYRAETLVMKHARTEFDEQSRFQSSRTKYTFSASLTENGDVALRVGYSFDDGFCMGSGSLFTKTIRPYDADEVQAFKKEKMLQIATGVYQAEQLSKERAAIMKIAKKMFKGEI